MVQGRVGVELHSDEDLAYLGDRLKQSYAEAIAIAGPDNGRSRLVIAERTHCVSLFFPEAISWHFDRAGRLIRAFVENHNFRRTRDYRFRVSSMMRQDTGKVLLRRRDGALPGLDVIGDVYEKLRRIHASLPQAHLRILRGAMRDPRAWIEERLSPIIRWDKTRLLHDQREFQRIYVNIPILPPDQYHALVLQITEGCVYNQCAFCNFYQDIPYRVKSLPAFQEHVHDVMRYYGRSLARYTRIFLGQANALYHAAEQVAEYLQVITEHFPILPAGLTGKDALRFKQEHPLWVDGLYSFMDAFHEFKSAQAFRRLHALGLRRIYLGFETGDDDLLHFMGKPGSSRKLVALVHAAKAGGVHVAPIVLIGAGGRRWATRHLENTMKVLRSMPLDRGDQVYVSRLHLHEGGAYAQRMEAMGVEPLTPAEERAQAAAIKACVRGGSASSPMVVTYDIGNMSCL